MAAHIQILGFCGWLRHRQAQVHQFHQNHIPPNDHQSLLGALLFLIDRLYGANITIKN